jgi:cytochrome P450
MTVGETITLEELETDPYPAYKRLRDEEPVSWVPAVQLWLVTRWDDVDHVARSPEVFTAATEPSLLNDVLGRCMLGTEGPEHERLRDVAEPPFRPRALEEHTKRGIPAMAEELLDALEGRGRVELVSEFARPMSILALRSVLGLDEIPVATISDWFAGFMVGASNFEGDAEKARVGREASDAASAGLLPIVERLEREPDASATSWMLHADSDAGRMSRDEVLGNVKLMMSGGLQEPQEAIALTVWALLCHPGQLAEVRGDPGLLRKAVEETFRCYSPVGTATRQTTRAAELAGVGLPAGALVGAVLSAANRDERRFADPDRFDVHRAEGAHLAFSTGPHVCLGMWLGRATTRACVQLLLDRFPRLRLDPDHEVEIRGWEFRGPQALHLRWD